LDDSLLFDWNKLFIAPNFHGEVLVFFQFVGHTSAVVPLIVAKDILHCIYSDFNFNVYFEKNERYAFSCIESLSHLFTIKSDMFYDKIYPHIRYYAISLNTIKSERTVTANIILNAFARNTSDYLVIMFRNENMCMLSFAKKTNSCIVFFSDWFDGASVFDIARRSDIVNLSLQNSEAYFLDFVYMTARSYYTNPLSKDYVYSEWSALNEDEEYDRPSRSDYIAKVKYGFVRKYGDDYIEIPKYEDYKTDNIGDKEYNFDLLKLELDMMKCQSLIFLWTFCTL
jgi:hypothetical protein